MTRVDVPGGGWFELKDINELTSDHQEQYLDLADELREQKRAALAAQMTLENPAIMPDPDDDAPVRLTRKDTGPIRELVEGWMVADSSFGVPLPKPLPLMASNVLRDALDPIFGALNGDTTPKENQASASTSSAT